MAFENVLKSADIVVLGLPLTEATTGLIDAEAIGRMRRGALLVNPARGSLVDEAAVADALERGHLGGYAADVFECEDWARPDRPRAIDARLTRPGARTVLTPHIGSAVMSVRREIELSAATSIIGPGRQGAWRGDQQPARRLGNPVLTNEMLNLTHARSFVTVIATRGVRAAARELDLAPSTIVDHIRQLEEVLATPLVVRQRGSAMPTDQGARFLPLARALVETAGRVRNLIHLPALRLAASSNVGTYLLQPHIAAFRQSAGIPINNGLDRTRM